MKKITSLLFLIFSLIASNSFGQWKEKLFYDENWKISTPAKASFYRLVGFNQSGTPVGTVKDYFITGELQGEGEAISVSKQDDTKSIWKNTTVSFFKSGRKSVVSNYDITGKFLNTVSWSDKAIAHFSYFETDFLNMLEDISLVNSNTYFNDVVAGKEIYNFDINLMKEQNETGGDSFSFYLKDTKKWLAMVSYSKERELIAGIVLCYDLLEAEKELLAKGFIKMVIQNENGTIVGTKMLSKWNKNNYPYKIVLRYSENDINNGKIIFAAKLADAY